MSKKIETERQHLQQEIDELRVQMALGKAEAADYIEEKKEEFSDFIDESKAQLKKVGEPVSAKYSVLHGKLDELKLQLALGKMESMDAFKAQREKIEKAIDNVQGHYDDLVESGGEELEELRDAFQRKADSFKTKFEVTALNTGAGVMLAADEIKDLCSSVTNVIKNVSTVTVEEIREARRYLRERIRKHKR